MPYPSRVFAAAAVLTCAAAAHAQQPNVLFILTEDQGTEMSFLGTGGLQSPNMDRIAANGVYFDQAFVNYPVCSASKANIYTGMHSHTNNLRANVVNYFKPLEELTQAELNNTLYNRLAIEEHLPTLITELDQAGYHLGVSHKLHVSRHDKFPYDVWDLNADTAKLTRFINDADAQAKPWFYMYNINQPHRPYPNSDNGPITVDANDPALELPGFLPDSPVIRQDWAEYLANVEVADARVGHALQALIDTGLLNDQTHELDNTVVVFMGDHGPAIHRGKVSPYDYGLRVPLAIMGPGFSQGDRVDEVVGAIDLMPTLLELVGVASPDNLQGRSLVPLLDDTVDQLEGRDYMFSEVHNRAQQVDDGQQERSVHDGRYNLIYRQDVHKPRTVNADLVVFSPWRNRVYDEIIALYNSDPNNPEYADAYRRLAEIDNSAPFGIDPPTLELYDVNADRWELNDLVNDPSKQGTVNRLATALYRHTIKTGDVYLDVTLIPAPGTHADDFNAGPNGGNLDASADWTTQQAGNGGADFTFDNGQLDAPAGPRALATYDGAVLGDGQDFFVSVKTGFNGSGVGGGLVFGYTDADNYYEFQLLDGDSAPGGANKDLRLRRRDNGVESNLVFINALPNYDDLGLFTLVAEYDADALTLDLLVLDENGLKHHAQQVTLAEVLPDQSLFGISTWSSNNSVFDDFNLQVVSPADLLDPALGDADFDGDIDDTDLGISISNFTGPVGAAGNKTAAQGDTDGDGDVDDTDLGVSISGFTGPLSPSFVPEPASIALVGFGGLMLQRRR